MVADAIGTQLGITEIYAQSFCCWGNDGIKFGQCCNQFSIIKMGLYLSDIF
jgi:hypothetical protein